MVDKLRSECEWRIWTSQVKDWEMLNCMSGDALFQENNARHAAVCAPEGSLCCSCGACLIPHGGTETRYQKSIRDSVHSVSRRVKRSTFFFADIWKRERHNDSHPGSLRTHEPPRVKSQQIAHTWCLTACVAPRVALPGRCHQRCATAHVDESTLTWAGTSRVRATANWWRT